MSGGLHRREASLSSLTRRNGLALKNSTTSLVTEPLAVE
jgi:hypothetical protein